MDVPQQGQKLSAEFGYKMLFLDEEGGEQNEADATERAASGLRRCAPFQLGKPSSPRWRKLVLQCAVRQSQKPCTALYFIFFCVLYKVK